MMNHNSMSGSIVEYDFYPAKKTKHSNSPLVPSLKGPRIETQHTGSNQPRRTRKAHNKVRTGCETCKIRRKKCDETKPACLRCTTTGRKCDGYTPSPPTQPALAAPVSLVALPSALMPIASYGSTPRVVELDADSGYCTLDQTPNDHANNGTLNEEELEDFILSYDGNARPHSSSPAASHTHSRQMRSRTDPCSRTPTTVIPRAPNFFAPGTKISDLELHCFSYFRHRTGPQFASYFDSSIFTYSIRGALAHPVLFNVAVALGAVHRRFVYGISREALEYCGHAARFHTNAVKGLNELKAQQVNSDLVGTADSGGGAMGICNRDVIMLAEMLLGPFEVFQGECGKAVQHMSNAMQYLLKRPMTLVHSETRYGAAQSKPSAFCQLFHRIHMRALALFDTPTNILAKWGDGLPLPLIPDVFRDIDEARDYIFTEVDWIMHAPARVWQDVSERSEAQNLHVSRLLKWSVAYADTVRDMQRTSRQKKACILMKLARDATYLLLYLTLFVAVDTELPRMSAMTEDIEDDEEQDSGLAYATRALWRAVDAREELNTNLARVQLLAEGILEEDGIFAYDEHFVSFDTGIGPPKGKDKIPESSNKTRHLVKQTMTRRCGDQNVTMSAWERAGIYGVAERVSALEEHAVIEAARAIVPAHIDPRWVDITCMMEARKFLLRYCRPDEYGLGMMFTQEWWAF